MKRALILILAALVLLTAGAGAEAPAKERSPLIEAAFALLEDIRAYFQNPAHEAEFQEWKKDPEKVRQAWKEDL